MNSKNICSLIILFLILCGSIAPTYAMRRDRDSFGEGALARIATTMIALGAGQRIEESSLPEEVKVPLFIALFTGGAYGLGWDCPPPITTKTSLLQSFASTTLALGGSWYLLKQLSLRDQNKARVFAALCGINLWRLCKAKAKGWE